MKSMITLILAVMSMSVACQKQSAIPNKEKKVLVMSIAGEPDSLDPRRSNNINADVVIRMLFQGLTRVQEDGKIALDLADSIQVSEDLKTYTIHLRNSRWSDGYPVCAKDFETSWKASLRKEAPVICANLLYPIKNAEACKKGEATINDVAVTALDEKTLQVELEKPTPFFLDLLSATIFFPVPSHLVDEVGEWGSKSGAEFVVNGPFRLDSWTHNHELLLTKNPLHCDSDQVVMDGIDVAIIANETTALRMFENGELDWVGGDFSPLPLDAIPSLKEKGVLQTTVYGGTRYCPFNTKTFPFNNVNMRKAFALAINRTKIVNNITHLQEPIATHMIASCLKGGHHVDLFQDADARSARAFFAKGLEELGIEASALGDITLKYEDAEISKRIAQALQQQWFEVLGVSVKLDEMELKVFVDSLRKRNFQIGLIYWMLHYNSPMDILDRYRTADLVKNYPSWENSEYTRLIDAYFLEPDEEKRHQILLQAEAIFINDMPVAPLYHFNSPFMVKRDLKGIEMTPIGDFYFGKATRL